MASELRFVAQHESCTNESAGIFKLFDCWKIASKGHLYANLDIYTSPGLRWLVTIMHMKELIIYKGCVTQDIFYKLMETCHL